VSVRVLLFGMIASKLGQHEMILSDVDDMTINDIVSLVKCDQFYPLLLAVNQEQVHDLNYVVQDGDEVALMPPFSGG